ncbi:serine/threonine-protein phosphatase 4 regulatory subunit 2 [Anoplophora glabripennis]|nr:serine/threonine-protein phosphatase 4 regulatory subunit 2 [Anoplophora glabripennis]
MENPEEILHSLEEFSKMKPKDIPRELEEYLCFVAKTGNPVYQWQTIKSLFREKLLNVITEFYESCPSVEIPPCPNVEMFNYDLMKNFILEKLDTFASAPFTVQRICELLTTPRKEYNRIDKYMRALEKNILVVSTTEPGRRSTENGEGIVNGIESEHLPESSNSSHDINVEEMDESPSWPRTAQMAPILFETTNAENQSTDIHHNREQQIFQNSSDLKIDEISSSSTTATKSQLDDAQETIISCSIVGETQHPYVSIEPVAPNTCSTSQDTDENHTDNSLSITALPAGVQQRRNSMERVETSESRSDKEQDFKENLFTEDEKQKTPEEDKQIHPLTEAVLSHPLCPEHVEVLADTKIEEHSEEKLPKDQPDMENISPENSSASAGTLKVDITPEKYKTLPQGIEEPDEKIPEQPQEVQIEVCSKEDEWSEDKEETEKVTSALTSTFLEENEVDESTLKTSSCSEHVSGLSNTHQQISEPLKEADTKSDTCEEKTSDNLPEPNKANIEEGEPVRQIISKLETPMDVDALSDITIDEKGEHLREEPSSTSDTL